MVKQMGEGLPGQGNGQILHMREVGLRHVGGLLHLLKDNLFIRAVKGAPGGNMGYVDSQTKIKYNHKNYKRSKQTQLCWKGITGLSSPSTYVKLLPLS